MKKNEIIALVIVVLLVVIGFVAITIVIPNYFGDVEQKEEEGKRYSLTGKIESYQNNKILVTLDSASKKELSVETVEVNVTAADLPKVAELVKGNTITVYYDGRMTRSIPPQIAADIVRMVDVQEEVPMVMQGEVVEMIGKNAYRIKLTTKSAIDVYGKELIVKTDNAEKVDEIVVGDYVDVEALNAASTKSMPPQISAKRLTKLVKEEGVVETISEKSITVKLKEIATEDMTSENMIVNVTDKAMLNSIVTGDTVVIYHSGAVALSYPPQITAIVLIKK